MKKTIIQLFGPNGDEVYEDVKSWGRYGDFIYFVIEDGTRRIRYTSTLKYLVIEDEDPAPQT
jgi:hypothetical protein